MGGVDLADQFICYYSVGRRNMKWWRKVAWRLYDHAICNAHVIYKYNTRTSLKKSKTNLEFWLELIHALTDPLLQERQSSGLQGNLDHMLVDSRLKGKHFPYFSDARKRCVVCSKKKVYPNGKAKWDTKTKTWCPKCKLHMCMGRCFELFHTKSKFRNY